MKIYWRILISVLAGFVGVVAAVAFRRLTGYDGLNPLMNAVLAGAPVVLFFVAWFATRRSN